MNILCIIPYPPSLVRVRPYQIIRSLHQGGHKITLLTVYSNPGEKADAEALAACGIQVRAFQLSTARSMINCARAYLAGEPMQARYSWHPGLAAAAAEMVGKAKWGDGEFDIVHVEHLRGVPYGLAARQAIANRHNGKSPGIPVVWDSVDCISYLFEQVIARAAAFKSRAIARLEIRNTRKYESRAAGMFDHMLVTSPVDCVAFHSLAGTGLSADKISVVPNGVDLEYFTPGSREERDPATLLVSGKMSYHANVSMVVRLVERILPQVRAEIPNVKLVVAGKDPSPIVRKYSADKGITITGTVPDLRPYLQKATVAVVPLAYGTGIQNKVLEAMACGTPVVASRQAASALCALPGRDLLVAEDDSTFARSIIDLLRNPVQRSKLGCAGRRYVENNHSWNQISGDLHSIYMRTIQSSRNYSGNNHGS